MTKVIDGAKGGAVLRSEPAGMTFDELYEACGGFVGGELYTPFENILIFRHASNGKWYALIVELDGALCVNLKCHPAEGEALRARYGGVRPAWHMNKRHWITVDVGADLPREEIIRLIEESFALTAPKTPQAHEETE